MKGMIYHINSFDDIQVDDSDDDEDDLDNDDYSNDNVDEKDDARE